MGNEVCVVGGAGRGVLWSAFERFGVQGFGFVVSTLLARLLMPSDYGLIAMVSLFLALATSLVDSGIAQTLIQRRDRTECDLSTALVFNIVVAVGLYFTLYFSAPLLARFYDAWDLVGIIRVLSVVLLFNSLSIVQQALFTIRLDFARMSAASFSGIIMGGVVSLVMARLGYGVWSLVALNVVSSFVRCLLLWVLSGWHPCAWFSYRSFRSLAGFSSRLMFSGLLHVLYSNMYSVIIGRRYLPSALGSFSYATTLGTFGSHNLSSIVDRALYPVLCDSHDDVDSMSDTVLCYLRRLCFFVFGAMVGLSLLAGPLIEVLLGEQWGGVAPLLRIVALAYMWDPVMKFVGSALKASGSADSFMRAEVVKKFFGFGIMALSVGWGVEGMCYGMIVYAFADMATIIFFSRRLTLRLGYCSIFRTVAPLALLSFAMGGVVLLFNIYVSDFFGFSALSQLFCGTFVGIGVYFWFAILFGRPEPGELFDYLRRLLR